MKNIQLQIGMLLLVIIITSCGKSKVEDTTVTDIDGNVYNTVKIGTQTWMKENLKVTKYRNGEAIPNVTDGTAWSTLTTGALADVDNTPSNTAVYGKLYNWFAATDSRNIAPTGWHVPSDSEWITLVTFLGGATIAGGKLREIDTTHWLSPNTTATNVSGFSGLGTGYRRPDGGFISFNFNTYFWTSTQLDAISGIDYGFYHQTAEIFRYDDEKKTGFPLRCLKD